LNALWDKCTIYRFASHYNSHHERFNSNVWYPATEKIDAFSQFWRNDMNWLVPPPSMITKTLNKIKQDKAKGILIIPVWKSAPYWPIIQKKDIFHEFIKNIHYLPQKDCIFTGDGKNGVFADNPLKFKMVATLKKQ